MRARAVVAEWGAELLGRQVVVLGFPGVARVVHVNAHKPHGVIVVKWADNAYAVPIHENCDIYFAEQSESNGVAPAG